MWHAPVGGSPCLAPVDCFCGGERDAADHQCTAVRFARRRRDGGRGSLCRLRAPTGVAARRPGCRTSRALAMTSRSTFRPPTDCSRFWGSIDAGYSALPRLSPRAARGGVTAGGVGAFCSRVSRSAGRASAAPAPVAASASRCRAGKVSLHRCRTRSRCRRRRRAPFARSGARNLRARSAVRN